MKSFDTWTYDDVEDVFGIKPVDSLPLLDEWTSASYQMTDYECFAVEQLKTGLKQEVKNWNKDELKVFFIGPILNIIQLKSEHYKPFTQRTFSTTINNIEIGGRVDFVIARGKK